MSIDYLELGRRAVACKGWRWLDGMLAIAPDRLGGCRISPVVPFTHAFNHYTLPDLTDPATVGCLIELVREAYSDEVAIMLGNGWWSVDNDFRTWAQDNTESLPHALIRALEDAP